MTDTYKIVYTLSMFAMLLSICEAYKKWLILTAITILHTTIGNDDYPQLCIVLG